MSSVTFTAVFVQGISKYKSSKTYEELTNLGCKLQVSQKCSMLDQVVRGKIILGWVTYTG